MRINVKFLLLFSAVANASAEITSGAGKLQRRAKSGKTAKNSKTPKSDDTPPDDTSGGSGGSGGSTSAAGCLYVGTSEKHDGSRIQKMCFDSNGNKVSGPYVLDSSGDHKKSYSTAFAYQEPNPYNNFYSSLKNGILWNCSRSKTNACINSRKDEGVWMSNLEFGPYNILYMSLADKPTIWKCNVEHISAQCPAIVLPDTFRQQYPQAITYDADSETLFVGTNGGFESNKINIYKVDNGDGVTLFHTKELPMNGEKGHVLVNSLKLVGNQLWVSYATKWKVAILVTDKLKELDMFGGGIFYLDLTTGFEHEVDTEKAYWGIAYSPDVNMVYAQQIQYKDFSKQHGYIYWISPTNGNHGVYADLGTMGPGMTEALTDPVFKSNSFLHKNGFLWIGTGGCRDKGCNTVFRCPALGSSMGSHQCTKLMQTDCSSITSSCKGVTALIYI